MTRFSSASRVCRLVGRRLCAALLMALAVAGVVAADPLPGAEDAAFSAALADWLADDEELALPALAALAESGNPAARLLLGQIDRTPALQGTFLAHVTRADRLRVLRAPGGLSGRNWLALIPNVPLAAALDHLRQVDADAALIDTFESLADPRAARETLITLAARESPSLADRPPESTDPELLYLLWRNARSDRRARIAALVPPGHPQRQLMGETLDSHDLDRWLAESATAAPLTALCATRCAGDQRACRAAAYRALASHDALLMLGTPAQSLVAQQDFLDSPRGQAAVLRRILLATPMRGRRAMLDRVAGQSACLGAVLTTENARYRRAIRVVNDNG